jgi:hypothetical protein
MGATTYGWQTLFLEFKTWSARTLYVYAHADLAQKHSVCLQEIFVSRLCSQEENSFFLPWLGVCQDLRTGLWWANMMWTLSIIQFCHANNKQVIMRSCSYSYSLIVLVMFGNFAKFDSPRWLVQFLHNFQTSLVLLIPNCTCHRMITYTNYCTVFVDCAWFIKNNNRLAVIGRKYIYCIYCKS